MRKFYSLLTGACIVLAHSQTNAQVGADSCRADFEQVPSTTINVLTAGFRALPWTNSDKRPEEICWNFGDNRDTCIKYDPSLSNNYYITHSYNHTGSYNVCVRISYQGGCIAYKCRVIQIGEPDSCSVKFETVNSTSSLVGKYFVAQPWNNHNKKPVLICWNFGDNRDTCIQYSTSYTGAYAVFHVYAQPGSYNVCVKIRFDGGCESYYCRVVQTGDLRDSCAADFDVLPAASTPRTRHFIAKPWHNKSKRPIYICWNFGDNRDTCIQYSNTNPGPYTVDHVYREPGRYEACVRIVYDGGCEAKKCKVVEIGEPDSCKVSFETLSSTSNSLGKYFVAQPWHNHNKKPVLVCWNFGDNRDTCIQYSTSYTGNYAVFHSYSRPGTYNVCVKMQYDGGCASHSCHFVQVGEADSCKVSFETLASASNRLGKYFVTKPWHNHNKKPVRICWNFGDNRDTCIEYSTSYTGPYAVFHSYSHAGNYNVCVKIRYDGGCESYYCRLVEVSEPDSCKVSFETLSSNSNRLGKYFIAKPWHNRNKKPVRICWNFGDNRDTCIEYSTSYTGPYAVFHSYSHAGNYNVCVKIRYDGGCESYYCHLVEVSERDSCKVSFETLSSTSNRLGKYFIAKPWHNHNKKPIRICWNFGDNRDTCIEYSTSYTGPYAVFHSYSHAGNYNVCVKILYDGGCESYSCHSVEVGEQETCRADFERIPVSTSNDASRVYYRALPWNNHDKKPARICWSFGDGKDTCISYPENYTGAYAVGHHYEHSGIYEVCVKILYYGGCEAKKCNIVSIFLYNDDCRVHLYEIVPGITSLTRGFYFSSPNDRKPVRICWSFGDGTDTCINVGPDATEIPRTIRHTYPAPGVYRACVKVLFANGCTASDCVEVNIRSVTGICGGYYTDSLVNPQTYVFKGFSIHKPDDAVVSYRWTFGDGSSGVGQQVTHTYNVAGIYRVCLLINTEKGCETRICNDVRVAGPTQSTLQLAPNPVVNVLHAVFYSTHNETVKIKIINASGMVVREYTRTAVIGSNTWEFDLAGLLAGTYSFVVQSPNQFASALFFKQ